MTAHFKVSPHPMKMLHITAAVVAAIILSTAGVASHVYGTNEGSYTYGYWQGSLTSPQIAPGVNWNPELDNNTCALKGSYILTYPKEAYGTVIPAVTNTTACKDGWFNGYKNWCVNHAVDCVENITIGDFPDMIVKTHQEYLRGYNAALGRVLLCPLYHHIHARFVTLLRYHFV
jgi:hypothetical protein